PPGRSRTRRRDASPARTRTAPAAYSPTHGEIAREYSGFLLDLLQGGLAEAPRHLLEDLPSGGYNPSIFWSCPVVMFFPGAGREVLHAEGGVGGGAVAGGIPGGAVRGGPGRQDGPRPGGQGDRRREGPGGRRRPDLEGGRDGGLQGGQGGPVGRLVGA